MRLAFQLHYWVIRLHPLLSCSEKYVLSSHVKKCKTEQLCMKLYNSGFWRQSPGYCVEEGSRFVRNLLVSLTYCLAMFIQEILFVKCC